MLRTSFAPASAGPATIRVSGGSEIVLRQPGAARIQQACGQPALRIRGAAERDRIEVHALKMDWRFVLLGIADRPERMLGLQRDPLPQRGALENADTQSAK